VKKNDTHRRFRGASQEHRDMRSLRSAHGRARAIGASHALAPNRQARARFPRPIPVVKAVCHR
jgi:hypothetical protein